MLWNSSALYSGSTSSVQNDIRINSFLVGFLRILLRFGQLNADFLSGKSRAEQADQIFRYYCALYWRMLWKLSTTGDSWLLEWIRIPSDACGQASWIWQRCGRENFESGKKSCGFKTIRIRVNKALKYTVHFHANVLQIQMSTLAATTLFALSVACIFHSSRCSKNSIRILQYNKTASQITLNAALLQTSNVFHIFTSIH